MTRVAVVLLALCLAVTASCGQAPRGDKQEQVAWAGLFPDGLQNAQGQPVALDQLAGKLVGVYFSAHWCPPCRVFTPKLVAFRDKNAARFEVVFVSSDRSRADMETYIKEAGMKWLCVPFRSQSAGALQKKYRVRGIPTLVVLSPTGEIVSETARADVTNSPDTALASWLKAVPAKK
jgi:nucleoredoxin